MEDSGNGYSIPESGNSMRMQHKRAQRGAASLAARHLPLLEKPSFNELAALISARFVNIPASEVEREIGECLRLVGEFCATDRCVMVEIKRYGKGEKVIYGHHLYVKEGLDESFQLPPGDVFDAEPGFRDYLASGRPWVCRSLEDIPPDWPVQRNYMEAVGISSAVVVPLIVAGELIGAIGVDSRENGREWPEDLVRWLRFVVEIFSSALAREQAEEKLARSERQLRLMADALPVLITYVDDELRYRFTNVAYNEWHGVDGDRILGLTVREVLGEQIYSSIEQYLQKALAGNRVSYEMDRSRKDGAVDRLEATYVPNIDPTGRVLGVYCLLQDITERKKGEREAQMQNNELARVARAVTMGALTVSLAHELNQPLAAILTNAQVAARYLAAESPNLNKVRDALADVVSDTQRAGKVISRARTLLQKSSVQRKTLSINQIVQEVLALVANDALLRDMTIKAELSEDLPPVLADSVQMQQVLLNLILNAFEAMKDIQHTREVVVRTLLKDDNTVVITVRDFGVGVDKKNLKKIFEPLFTTRSEGMGMGLSISRSIVEAHGGRIWATSNSKKGATFSVALPAFSEDLL